MAHYVENYASLDRSLLRHRALEIVEAAYRSIDTDAAIRSTLVVQEGTLFVGTQQFRLDTYSNIYIIGFGKASCAAARTLEDILRSHVRRGAVVGVNKATCDIVETYTGTHPIPSPINYAATKPIMSIAQHAGNNDLVIVLVSGGGSALLCSSLDECDQSSRLYKEFLNTGGTIAELNCVRKHLSTLKGGGLAKLLYPATVLGLIFSDVPGDDMSSVASGPTFFDASTVADAETILQKYNLSGYTLIETPKETKYFERVYNALLVSNRTALEAMERRAGELRCSLPILGSNFYMTAHDMAALLLQHPEGACAGGETRIVVPPNTRGLGGRNTHLALTALPRLKPGQVFVSISSDGHDNTLAAGAIVDYNSQIQAKELGIDPRAALDAFDSANFFAATDDLIVTGLLDSNVSDLMFLLSENEL